MICGTSFAGTSNIYGIRMTQKHFQYGLFHVTTNAKKHVPWCTSGQIPPIILDNLFMTRNLYDAKVYAFCILPDHMHIIVNPGDKGLSQFMHSFKRNAMRDIRANLRLDEYRY